MSKTSEFVWVTPRIASLDDTKIRSGNLFQAGQEGIGAASITVSGAYTYNSSSCGSVGPRATNSFGSTVMMAVWNFDMAAWVVSCP